MRKNVKIDNRKVIAPNAHWLQGRGKVVKAGMLFVYRNGEGHGIGRSLGRVSAPQEGECEKIDGYVLAMVLSNDATFGFERWINPDDIVDIFESPSKFAQFFFQPKLPYDAQTMRRLMDYGTMCESYIDNASEHVAQ